MDSPSLSGLRMNQQELQDRIEKGWQDICEKFKFCHSPGIVLDLLVRGMMEDLIHEGHLSYWQADITAEIIVNETHTEYHLVASARIVWRMGYPGAPAGLITSEHVPYDAPVWTNDFATEWKTYLRFGHNEGNKAIPPHTKKVSRWELVMNEEENASPLDREEHQQEDRSDTSKHD